MSSAFEFFWVASIIPKKPNQNYEVFIPTKGLSSNLDTDINMHVDIWSRKLIHN